MAISTRAARFTSVLFAVGVSFAAMAVAQEAEQDHSLTVYSRLSPGAVDARVFQRQISNPDYRQNVPGYAIVRTRAPLELPDGVGRVDFTDVAAGLDPTTVKFESLTDPDGTRVLQQDFLFDLASTDQMLQRYLEQTIEVQLLAGERTEVITGRLLAAREGDLLIETENEGVVSVAAGPRNIRFPELADGLLTRPTLRWEVSAEESGEHEVQVTYETLGMTWWTDYTLVQDDEDGYSLELSAWVSLINQTGEGFENAGLKLVAGDVNRAAAARPVVHSRATMVMESAAAPSFSEQAIFEYHLYTLDRRVDLPDRSLTQLELFPDVRGVPCERTLRVPAALGTLYGSSNAYITPQYPIGRPRADVNVFLAFQNDEEAGLGVPMPRGRMRVSRRDPNDGALEFIGEDNVDHTPRREEIELALGTAFDVVVERRQADFAWSKAERWIEETIEVTLRNRKRVDEIVEVDETLYRWSNWRLIDASHEFEKLDAARVRFRVPVPADEEVVLRYVARYEW